MNSSEASITTPDYAIPWYEFHGREEFSSSETNTSNTNPTNSSSSETNVENGTKASNFDPPSGFYYNMSGEKILVIFNHYKFEDTRHFGFRPDKREGTDKDVEALKNVFTDIGFKVRGPYTDYRYRKIITAITEIANEDHSKTSCLAVVILTHGDAGGVVYAADRPYPLSDVIRIVQNGDKGLVNKPVLFFVQACRGNKTDAGRIVDDIDGNVDSTILVPTYIDFLLMQSTVEDHFAYKNLNGSWMIQELCKVIKEYHHSMDLLQLITLANWNVAYDRITWNPKKKQIHNKKQTMETQFTLTRLVKI